MRPEFEQVELPGGVYRDYPKVEAFLAAESRIADLEAQRELYARGSYDNFIRAEAAESQLAALRELVREAQVEIRDRLHSCFHYDGSFCPEPVVWEESHPDGSLYFCARHKPVRAEVCTDDDSAYDWLARASALVEREG